MKYTVTVNGKEYDVEVERAKGVYKTVRRAVGPRRATVAPAPGPNAALTNVPGPARTAPAASPTSAAAPTPAEGSILSPMPGNMWEVRCAPGDTVTAGQVVFVLEAMKMEIEVPAPAGGTIAQVLVQKGDPIESGAVLATLQ